MIRALSDATPMDHALPTEIVEVLDATVLFLAQLTQQQLLPSPWQEEAGLLREWVAGMAAQHVWRGA